ncbi:uncharacterized protein DFL_001566 [Arthrobotrys flagrans]|uniref:Uncharacterized protein n=1 Tax=Arthrobotrys flagrans TaxID=97331 RepID=A0A437A7Y9_ARTFL|nr:hypothetical protein DFL_001566 [Arthrobotrys flagrans]
MREPVDDNGETITFSHGFWNVWAGELVKFSVVPTLHTIRGKAGKISKDFAVLRSGDEVRVNEVKTIAEQEAIRAKCKATDPGKSWGYWKRNIEEEEEDVEVGEIVELGFL